jgi:uncharacterized protein (TIGR02231 family)
MVRVYEDRAEVVRIGAVELSRGPQWIAISGVTALVDDRSVQAEIRAEGARVISARVLRRVRDAGEEVAGAEALEKRTESLLDEHHSAHRAELRAQAALTRSEGSLADWLAGVARVPELDRPEVRAQWIEAFGELVRADDRAIGESLESAKKKSEIAETAAALIAKLSGLRTEQPRIDAVIEVQVHAEHPCPAEIGLRYRTPCAVWRPEHLARLSHGSDGAAKLELTTFGVVWQATGEDWTEVEVELSTARPARMASAPLLEEDRIKSRRKTDEERQKIVIEQREQEIQVAGIGDRARAVHQMPGVDDGGEPLTYRSSGRVTLPSNGRPYRVEVAHASLDASAARILVPELQPAAHWRAASTLTAGGPLLAGPVRSNRNGTMVGRGKTDFVGRGEAFELGFGPDDAVRARRKQTEKRDRTMLTGTQKIDRKVRLYLSNLSGETKEVTVLERIPVSEIDEVEIALTEGASEWKHDARDGFLRRKLLLGARETKEIGYSYEIRAKSNVELPF